MLLNCHTYYSFCYGTFSIGGLLDEVQKKGYDRFVLTDINNTSACLETIRQAREKGVKPIMGIDFRNDTQQVYIGIARNNTGFRELNEHLSAHLHETRSFDAVAPEFEQAYIVYPQAAYKGWKLRENEFIGISPQDLPQLPFLTARYQPGKLVVLHTVSFAHTGYFNAHRLLRSIDTNNLLSKLPTAQQATGQEIMLPAETLRDLYKDFPHIMANTERILEDCSIEFHYDKKANLNKQFRPSDGSRDIDVLRSKCLDPVNIQYRYPDPAVQTQVLARINKELDVIAQLNFASYYLVNWDIVSYARRKGYYYVGRGSGSNSILAYILRITDVDPIELDLYFERFINVHRNNAPDFDIDFSWRDRNDITRHIFEQNGNKHTALLGSYSTFQHDAVTRELGKVFGLPPAEIDRLQNNINDKGAGLDKIGSMIKKYSQVIRGFPSHLSIHSSGIIISEEPVCSYSATSLPPKGYPTTQFSMLEAEDIGLYKFDILGQRGLGKIKDSLAIIRENKGETIDIYNIKRFKEDEKVKQILRVGNTIGCFYVESPAMRMLLAKLAADDYLRLVAASSIIRPGVAKSGMMRQYIVRFREPEKRLEAEKELPELYDLLRETYGVMVYQEDVIRIAHLFADLTLAEADNLRRGMSWKFKQRNEFDLVREKFFTNCRLKGYEDKLVDNIWRQIESFANFAFSKGHSASYAVESYQALFLKAYYPLEYITATLNNGGGFYRMEHYVHEARMNGADIKAPCLNNSNDLCVIKGKTIYLGLSIIAQLEQQVVQEILEERQKNGSYRDLPDFVKRVPLSIEQMRILIRANTFQFTNRNKKELLWEIHALLQPAAHQHKPRTEELFETQTPEWQLPELSASAIDEAFDQIELLGFPLCSPFSLLKDPLPSQTTASDMKKHVGKTITMVGYLVNIKNTYASGAHSKEKERMCFGTFTDIEGQWIDTVHFPAVARRFPFTGPGCYELRGRIDEEYSFTSMAVDYMKRLPMISRD
jgi:DNA polymerase-3 subunit alpha